MNIQILQCLDGAKCARGLTVVIDVFRAFSLECFFMNQGAATIYPVGSDQLAYSLKEKHPDWMLAGERHGIKLPGFDFGNSPTQMQGMDLTGRTNIHTTSAGTQGIDAAIAAGADEVLTGSLLNARAIARYIEGKNPEEVSLACMGFESFRPADEDTLCAEYIRSLLLHDPIPEDALTQRAEALRFTDGGRFFAPENQSHSPSRDFYLCTQFDIFDFILKLVPGEDGLPRVIREDIVLS